MKGLRWWDAFTVSELSFVSDREKDVAVRNLLYTFIFLIAPPRAAVWAQLEPPNAAGVSLGHFHTIVRDESAPCRAKQAAEGNED